MTRPDIAAIRARAEAATEGPWEYVNDYIGVRQVPMEQHELNPNKFEVEGIVPGDYIRPEDGLFMEAFNPERVLELLDEIDQLRADVSSTEEMAADYNEEIVASHARLAAVEKLHQERPNSVSALHPTPLCSCDKEYPCPTIKAVRGE